MLRISQAQGDKPVKLLLEGRVAGQWINVLLGVCDDFLAAGRSLHLDLSGVSFLEAEGIETLDRLRLRGVTLVNGSPFVMEQLKSSQLKGN